MRRWFCTAMLLLAACSRAGGEGDAAASPSGSGLPPGMHEITSVAPAASASASATAAAATGPVLEAITPEEMDRKVELVGVACTFHDMAGKGPLLGSDESHAVIRIDGALIALPDVSPKGQGMERGWASYAGGGYALKVSWDDARRHDEGIEGASWPASAALRGPGGVGETQVRGTLTCGA